MLFYYRQMSNHPPPPSLKTNSKAPAYAHKNDKRSPYPDTVYLFAKVAICFV